MISATRLLMIILDYVGLLYGSLCSESAVAEHRAESGSDKTKRFVFGANSTAGVTA